MDHIYVKHSGNNVSCAQSILDVLVVTAKVHYMGFVSGLHIIRDMGYWRLNVHFKVFMLDLGTFLIVGQKKFLMS